MTMANLCRGLTMLLSKTMTGVVLLPPFCRCRNWGAERVSDLPQVTQLEGQVSNSRAIFLNSTLSCLIAEASVQLNFLKKKIRSIV